MLIDTGASHAYASRDLMTRLGMSVRPCSLAQATAADGTAVTLQGSCELRLRMGPLSTRVQALVVGSLVPGVDLILGDAWLAQHRATLDYGAGVLRLWRGTQAFTLTPMHGCRPAPGSPEAVVDHCLNVLAHNTQCATLMSAKQARRAIRRGASTMLAIVRPDNTCMPPDARQGPPEAVLASVVPDAAIQGLLDEFQDVFAEPPAGLPPDRGVGHTIPTEAGAAPTSRRLIRLSPAELAEVKRQVADLLAKGYIEPSTSPYGAPVLFVKKKTGELRMVVDYRALNAITVKNKFPLPRIDDLFDKLQGATVFSSIDLTAAYNQIRITPEDVPKTAFRTPFGLYNWRVLCFGLSNAPATFQAVMNRVLAPFLDRFVLVYLDDIIIFSNTPEEHLVHLKAVLTRLRAEKLYVKMSKCTFRRPELEWLGHIVGRDGLRTNPAKVAALADYPAPRTLTELRSFLGLANFFRRFVQGYASLVAPLTDLLRGAPARLIEWGPVQATTFAAVKRALTSAPVLTLPDPELPYEVVTDASLNGTGGLLLQEGRPLAFLSRKFSPAERNYTTGEQELLAVVHALTEWRCYLEGAPGGVTVVTDQCTPAVPVHPTHAVSPPGTLE